MLHPGSHDRIIISRRETGAYVYCAINNSADRGGTVIDFFAHRAGRGLSLPQLAQQFLEPLLTGGIASCSTSPHSAPPLVALPRDRAAVEIAWQQFQPLENGVHLYLNTVRKLPAKLLARPEFFGLIRRTEHGDAAFLHQDSAGVITGFEVKGAGERSASYTSFARGGRKSLFISHPVDEVHRLVLCESGCDAMAYFALFARANSQVASFAGGLSPAQRAQITATIRALLPGATVVIATDYDAGGDQLADELLALIEAAERPDLGIQLHQPDIPHADWSDIWRLQVAAPGVSRPAP